LAQLRAGVQDVLPREALTGPLLARALRFAMERQSADTELTRQALHDPLTGLPNRVLLSDRLAQGLGRLSRSEAALALLLLDLDGFKAVNDRHGHSVGDDCLRRFASGLRECFRPNDALVRYAGDEFVVVAQGLDPQAARERIDRLRARLRDGGPHAPEVAFSVGTAVLEPGGQPDAALEVADRSMYEAKAAGSGRPA
jgi:diguanylate cyclase (GGDEF)-like protein